MNWAKVQMKLLSNALYYSWNIGLGFGTYQYKSNLFLLAQEKEWTCWRVQHIQNITMTGREDFDDANSL